MHPTLGSGRKDPRGLRRRIEAMRHAAKPRTGAANLKWPRGADSLPSVVDIVVPLGVALLTVLGTVFSRGLPWKGERDRIARDLDHLMERLPAASEGRKLLGDQVERRIQGADQP
jgi:hypothetical protein